MAVFNCLASSIAKVVLASSAMNVVALGIRSDSRDEKEESCGLSSISDAPRHLDAEMAANEVVIEVEIVPKPKRSLGRSDNAMQLKYGDGDTPIPPQHKPEGEKKINFETKPSILVEFYQIVGTKYGHLFEGWSVLAQATDKHFQGTESIKIDLLKKKFRKMNGRLDYRKETRRADLTEWLKALREVALSKGAKAQSLPQVWNGEVGNLLQALRVAI